jgi:hypothetical protein
MNLKGFGSKWLRHKKVLSWHLSGWSEENYKKIVVSVPAETETEYLLITSLEGYN